MKIITYSSICSVCVSILLSSCQYQREQGCYLDAMRINGKVTKIETIAITSVPETEMWFDTFDPHTTISMFAGNAEIDFDRHGNVKTFRGYGVDKKLLFECSDFSSDNPSRYSPAVAGGSGYNSIDYIETEKDSNGDIVNIKYYSNNELKWNQTLTFNERGDVDQIVKDYVTLYPEPISQLLPHVDTTRYHYLSFDEQNNWTAVAVEYKGVYSRHNYTYKVLRQITYDGEKSKTPLLNQLSIPEELYPIGDVDKNWNHIELQNYGNMQLPNYMSLDSSVVLNSITTGLKQFMTGEEQFAYLFMAEYTESDAYASFSVSKTYNPDIDEFDDFSDEDVEYSQELDEYLETTNREQMAQGGTFILRWLPYEFVKISGHGALKLRYYRYGKGSPIPVYCVNYILPMKDHFTLSIIYGFQSNLADRFQSDFEAAIASIQLN